MKCYNKTWHLILYLVFFSLFIKIFVSPWNIEIKFQKHFSFLKDTSVSNWKHFKFTYILSQFHKCIHWMLFSLRNIWFWIFTLPIWNYSGSFADLSPLESLQTEPPTCRGLWETQEPEEITWGLLVYHSNWIIIEMIVLKTF